MTKSGPVVGLLVTAALTLPTAAPAVAAPVPTGCGEACDQQDPQTYNTCGAGCPDNVPQHCADEAVTPHVSARGWVELRYSATCRTVWSRVGAAFPAHAEHWTETRYSNGRLRLATTPTTQTWSPMLSDADLAGRACAATLGPSGRHLIMDCTPWF
ncbi:hypothetical protein ACWT_5017 [Actinoplanes sp. SE50]|uniref:DUF2690 domain-containing protein n=1 Tax=unclassified Actinoplanes TaxID=2626549 RepID=UPI00023ECD28|nr:MULTISPECIES: DUF2690 domain-containing protein [unclassified Actinoplanes]AEV86034.1 hypothetical protein ACPL_5147 [Actinoplanes sp. SE50/110]ATO84432.1 hypothetical protein ACWT_5017 [Actinoplanes sp. SE50]SLM01842.1 hypothetical protein ACSP50_5080 [Actinoplanes sp. SE50/110]